MITNFCIIYHNSFQLIWNMRGQSTKTKMAAVHCVVTLINVIRVSFQLSKTSLQNQLLCTEKSKQHIVLNDDRRWPLKQLWPLWWLFSFFLAMFRARAERGCGALQRLQTHHALQGGVSQWRPVTTVIREDMEV
jgi:hypothetical protein